MLQSDLFPPRLSAFLDTNILTQLAREKRAEAYRPVFEFLVNNNHEIFLLDASRFELAGFSSNKKDYDHLLNWIDAFMITANIQDFPVSIFDVKHIEVIEDDKRANMIGFITYNQSKWELAQERFRASGDKSQ
jgi:predicted nucleic acid-binding protein